MQAAAQIDRRRTCIDETGTGPALILGSAKNTGNGRARKCGLCGLPCSEAGGRPPRATSRYQADLPLVPDREHPHLVLRDDEPVQRDVTRLAVGNQELPDVAVHAPPEQRVRGQGPDGGANGRSRRDCCIRVLACQEPERALEVGQCPRRMDYRRHGFGRAAP